MKAFLSICGSLLLLAATAEAAEHTPKAEATNKLPQATAARAWPHELSDAKPDARVVWGKLDNGLRYALLPTKSAPTRASLRMVVLAGSGMEHDDQQGMAHFLEHMAFNGTKNFPSGQTFEYFQRLGMAFGAHTNAVTEIDNTIYHLELPRANEELTTHGLRLFRDFLDGMTLGEAEIEKERGVILNEQLARNTPGYRRAVGPIGDDEFARAIKPMIDGIDAMRRDNNYWLTAIADCQERPAALTDIRSRDADYRAITKSEVAALAKRYLNADAAVLLSAVPRSSNETAHQSK